MFASNKGASVVEYALALAILFFIFFFANQALDVASSTRYDRSLGAIRSMGPCGTLGTSAGLSSEECL